MIKRLASFISALVLCILILPLSGQTAKAEMLKGYPKESALIDENGLYNDDKAQFDELDRMIKEEARKMNMNLIVFTAGIKRGEREVEIFADDSFDEIFGEDTDGLFLYIDISGNSPANDWISTSGNAVFKYKNHIEDLLDALYAYLPPSSEKVYAEDITSAVKAYLNCLDRYKDKKPSPFECDYDPDSKTYAYYKNGEYTVSEHRPLVLFIKPFLIYLAVGIIVSLIVNASIKYAYKFKGSFDPKAYISNELSSFRVNQDIYIRTDTKKTRISSESSGSGHRSGGGHSSGGSHSHSGHHGGGGRHR